MNPDNVITAFVAHLEGLDNAGLVVNSWPDKKNSSTPDIDAIAGNFAIEHTSTEVIDGMRERNAWFMKAAGELEAELNPSMQFLLRIRFDYGAIQKGQNWNDIKNALRDWIINQSPLLPSEEGFRVMHASGVPFELHVEKVANETPMVTFGRGHDPANDTLETSIGPQIIRKAKKLVPYTQKGMIGILLIQSEDLAFMNRVRLARAIVATFPNSLPEGVHQIWYADATIPGHLEFHDLTALGELVKQEEVA